MSSFTPDRASKKGESESEGSPMPSRSRTPQPQIPANRAGLAADATPELVPDEDDQQVQVEPSSTPTPQDEPSTPMPIKQTEDEAVRDLKKCIDKTLRQKSQHGPPRSASEPDLRRERLRTAAGRIAQPGGFRRHFVLQTQDSSGSNQRLAVPALFPPTATPAATSRTQHVEQDEDGAVVDDAASVLTDQGSSGCSPRMRAQVLRRTQSSQPADTRKDRRKARRIERRRVTAANLLLGRDRSHVSDTTSNASSGTRTGIFSRQGHELLGRHLQSSDAASQSVAAALMKSTALLVPANEVSTARARAAVPECRGGETGGEAPGRESLSDATPPQKKPPAEGPGKKISVKGSPEVVVLAEQCQTSSGRLAAGMANQRTTPPKGRVVGINNYRNNRTRNNYGTLDPSSLASSREAGRMMKNKPQLVAAGKNRNKPRQVEKRRSFFSMPNYDYARIPLLAQLFDPRLQFPGMGHLEDPEDCSDGDSTASQESSISKSEKLYYYSRQPGPGGTRGAGGPASKRIGGQRSEWTPILEDGESDEGYDYDVVGLLGEDVPQVEADEENQQERVLQRVASQSSSAASARDRFEDDLEKAFPTDGGSAFSDYENDNDEIPEMRTSRPIPAASALSATTNGGKLLAPDEDQQVFHALQPDFDAVNGRRRALSRKNSSSAESGLNNKRTPPAAGTQGSHQGTSISTKRKSGASGTGGGTARESRLKQAYGAATLTTAFILTKSMIGTGIFTLSKPLGKASIVTGSIVYFGVSFLCGYSALALTRARNSHYERLKASATPKEHIKECLTFEGLAGQACGGAYGKVFFSLFLLASEVSMVIASCIAAASALADVSSPVIPERVFTGTFLEMAREQLILLLVTLLLIPQCWVRKIKFFVYNSFIGAVVTLFCLFYVLGFNSIGLVFAPSPATSEGTPPGVSGGLLMKRNAGSEPAGAPKNSLQEAAENEGGKVGFFAQQQKQAEEEEPAGPLRRSSEGGGRAVEGVDESKGSQHKSRLPAEFGKAGSSSTDKSAGPPLRGGSAVDEGGRCESRPGGSSPARGVPVPPGVAFRCQTPPVRGSPVFRSPRDSPASSSPFFGPAEHQHDRGSDSNRDARGRSTLTLDALALHEHNRALEQSQEQLLKRKRMEEPIDERWTRDPVKGNRVNLLHPGGNKTEFVSAAGFTGSTREPVGELSPVSSHSSGLDALGGAAGTGSPSSDLADDVADDGWGSNANRGAGSNGTVSPGRRWLSFSELEDVEVGDDATPRVSSTRGSKERTSSGGKTTTSAHFEAAATGGDPRLEASILNDGKVPETKGLNTNTGRQEEPKGAYNGDGVTRTSTSASDIHPASTSSGAAAAGEINWFFPDSGMAPVSLAGMTLYSAEYVNTILPIYEAHENKQNFSKLFILCTAAVSFLGWAISLTAHLSNPDSENTYCTHDLPGGAMKLLVQLCLTLGCFLSIPILFFVIPHFYEKALFNDLLQLDNRHIEAHYCSTATTNYIAGEGKTSDSTEEELRENNIAQKKQLRKWGKNVVRSLLLCGIVSIAILLGEKNVRAMNSVVGGLACAPLAFIFPMLIYDRLGPENTTLAERIFNYAVIGFGALAGIMCTYMAFTDPNGGH